ncbi:MAG: thiol protease/hemagglutinin PrtT [Bacteroidales bacterium]|nr:thiol protease/hemagglutinin PrtT [Bacteroidales bacterium]
MKKLSLLFGLIVLTAMGLHAGPVSQHKAQQLGARFLSTTTLNQRSADIQLNLVTMATDLAKGAVDYYVFNMKGGEGFVIVAGDDRVKPILAYSTTGSYNPEDVAEGFAYTLGVFQKEIQYVREHNLSATPDIVDEWNRVTSTGHLFNGRSARSVVGPLCQTIWNQNFPYSSQCPEDEEGSGGHVYAGCVATAMGQVMKYHEWPERGTGSHSYNPSGYEQQTANFGETDYHFELMPLALDSTSTEEDYYYIAQFLHHCGIAVDMQYSGHGSGAYSMDVPPALRNYFSYTCDDDVTLGFWGWNFYSNEEWIQMLKEGGLDEQLPLYYSGADDNGAGGHAFVCDGYDENDYFHFNWGWSGRDDAWCPIGALNTTKYAFNDQNGFIGHIIPQNSVYYQRTDSVANFMVEENAAMNGVVLSWDNPSLDLNGNALTAIESVTIRRDNQEIATLTDIEVGAAMTYEDNDLEPGLYEYAIFVTNEAGISRAVYRSILVGDKCEVTFVLHDEGGNGWKGAAISVTIENGQRIAIISMEDGAEQTVTVPLLKQQLNFVWNHGWYHTQEQYDTDYECSFTVIDANGNELYQSEQLEDGIFMTYENNCEEGPLTCHPVRNLQGVYEWHNGEEYGAYLTWERPMLTANLDHFRVVRSNGVSKSEELIAEIPYEGGSNYEFFDNTYDIAQGDTYYAVNSVYVRGEEQCESEYMDVMVGITDVDESQNTIFSIYPNPTSGTVTVEGTGRLTVMNMLGQTIRELDLNGKISLELPRGVFFVRNNGTTKKLVVE